MFSAYSLRGLVVLALAVGCVPGVVDEPAGGFEDVASEWGLVHATFGGGTAKVHVRESLGQGLCWTDYDRDGDPDLFVPNGATDMESAASTQKPWRFYRNDGSRFRELASTIGLSGDAWGIGCAVGDLDGDGYDDLFVTTAGGPNRLFHNRRDGSFEDWTVLTGVGDRQLGTGAAFGDLDGDGDLDLVVARYLDESSAPDRETCRWKQLEVMCGPKGFEPLSDLIYLNTGGGRLEETGAALGISRNGGFGLGVLLLDANDDGRRDLFVANDSTPNHLYLATETGRFIERGLSGGVALSETGSPQAGMGIDAGDLDGDGWEDLVATNFSDDVNNFFHRDGPAIYSEWSGRSGLAASSFFGLSWGVLLEDFDLDGDLDAFFANGHVYPQVDDGDPNSEYRQPPQLLFNSGGGQFVESPELLGEALQEAVAGRGAAVADFDLDGAPDLAITRDQEAPRLLRNRLAGSDAGWMRLRLIADGGNSAALGAWIEVTARGRSMVREVRSARGYLSASEPVPTFGLGETPEATRVEIRWPSGGRQALTALPAGHTWIVVQTRLRAAAG